MLALSVCKACRTLRLSTRTATRTQHLHEAACVLPRRRRRSSRSRSSPTDAQAAGGLPLPDFTCSTAAAAVVPLQGYRTEAARHPWEGRDPRCLLWRPRQRPRSRCRAPRRRAGAAAALHVRDVDAGKYPADAVRQGQPHWRDRCQAAAAAARRVPSVALARGLWCATPTPPSSAPPSAPPSAPSARFSPRRADAPASPAFSRAGYASRLRRSCRAALWWCTQSEDDEFFMLALQPGPAWPRPAPPCPAPPRPYLLLKRRPTLPAAITAPRRQAPGRTERQGRRSHSAAPHAGRAAADAPRAARCRGPRARRALALVRWRGRGSTRVCGPLRPLGSPQHRASYSTCHGPHEETCASTACLSWQLQYVRRLPARTRRAGAARWSSGRCSSPASVADVWRVAGCATARPGGGGGGGGERGRRRRRGRGRRGWGARGGAARAPAQRRGPGTRRAGSLRSAPERWRCSPWPAKAVGAASPRAAASATTAATASWAADWRGGDEVANHDFLPSTQNF